MGKGLKKKSVSIETQEEPTHTIQKKKVDHNFGLDSGYKDDSFEGMDQETIKDILNQNFIFKEFME